MMVDSVGLALKDHGRNRTLKGLPATSAVSTQQQGQGLKRFSATNAAGVLPTDGARVAPA